MPKAKELSRVEIIAEAAPNISALAACISDSPKLITTISRRVNPIRTSVEANFLWSSAAARVQAATPIKQTIAGHTKRMNFAVWLIVVPIEDPLAVCQLDNTLIEEDIPEIIPKQVMMASSIDVLVASV